MNSSHASPIRFSGALLIAGIALASMAHAQLPTITTVPAPPEPGGAITLDVPPAPGPRQPESWIGYAGHAHLRNVTIPTLTPVLPPKGKGNGLAVVIAPGGGYLMLSMDQEGWDEAHWLARHGIAAFVLKYRLDETKGDANAFAAQVNAVIAAAIKNGGSPDIGPHREALADAQAAMRLVRADAAKWGVDPHRVGFMGFSAGAMTTLDLIAADAPGTVPDFAASIYGPMQAMKVPADAPPLFVGLASDDPLFGGKGFGVIDSWQAAKHPVELHLFERGGHGFGMGTPGTTSTHWIQEFDWWLQARGLDKQK